MREASAEVCSMRPRLRAYERQKLERILRTQSGETRTYRRARMVLLAIGGDNVASIARALGTSRARVTDWLRRFERERLGGLEDRPRSGRPRVISALERHQVIAAACQSPRELGVERNVWTHQALADALVASGRVRAVSATTAGEILDEADIKPHRVKMWCHSDDPDFQNKMRAIVRLYVRRPRGEPVLCIDEKTGMQALLPGARCSPRGRASNHVRTSSTGVTGRAASSPASTQQRGGSWADARCGASARTSSHSWIWSQPRTGSDACISCSTT